MFNLYFTLINSRKTFDNYDLFVTFVSKTFLALTVNNMIYNSFNFIILFPIIFLTYFCIPSQWNRCRNLFLLTASYLLYINLVAVYALVLLFVTLVTYLSALWISNHNNKKLKVMASGIIITLIPLLLFKYYDFVNSIMTDAMATARLRFSLPGHNWAVPTGISFFTLQALGYLCDVYYGKIKAEKDLIDYALFMAFFPSFTSGPINRAALILPQLKEQRIFDDAMAVKGLKMMLWGMFMKVVIADRMGMYVDIVMDDFRSYSGMTCLIASLLYSVQIYSDFAGYSLMAIGTGQLLGIRMSANFNRPYLAVSVTDFWRRWHISLSTWLRDYIYKPMGGSRCSKKRCYMNIFTTFLVSGLWHGANWTFIIWGLLHGGMLMVEKMLGIRKLKTGSRWERFIRIVLTFTCINMTWIVFRVHSISDGLNVIGKILTMDSGTDILSPGNKNVIIMVTGIIMLFTKDLSDEFFPDHLKLFDNKSRPVRWVSYTVVMIMVLSVGMLDSGQFIYAKF